MCMFELGLVHAEAEINIFSCLSGVVYLRDRIWHWALEPASQVRLADH